MTNEITCTVINNNQTYTSDLRGIKPLLIWLRDNPEIIEGGYVIDKIIGKASAMLLIYGKVAKVHGKTMSKDAAKMLEKHNIPYSYDILADHIINRENTGLCPMETAVLEIDDIKQAYKILNEKVLKNA